MKGKSITCNKMKVTVFSAILVWCIIGTNTLIIPDELPSLLSVIYSNIPTIKKGTDSRIGWGFRLGDRADFQVMVELGPQTNTQPLANQGEAANTKRNTLENLANVLYAQNQQAKKSQKEKKLTKKPSSNNDAEGWLKSWSESARGDTPMQPQIRIPPHAKPGLGIGEIDAKSVIPEDLEVTQEQGVVEVAPASKLESSTPKEGALDDVDLE